VTILAQKKGDDNPATEATPKANSKMETQIQKT